MDIFYDFSTYSDSKEKVLRLSALEAEIDRLPAGSIGTKKVNGKTYYYHRFYENGKRKEKYIPKAKLSDMQSSIEKRRALEEELKSLKSELLPAKPPVAKASAVADTSWSYDGIPLTFEPMQVSDNVFRYHSGVIKGSSLRIFAEQSSSFGKRECFHVLQEYISGYFPDKVLILYGLRRTGKTTMMRQAIAEMPEEVLEKTAFIQVVPGITLADINTDLKVLASQGYRYIFIDEATLLSDFIEGAALFSDIFASCGMKIILSGTDSLGFMFSEDSQLYDRCVMVHTTFIPYREFERLLGVCGVDEYIRYGGTLSLGGAHYNENSTFSSAKSTDEYVDSAIANNIQHSLKCYQDGDHFRNLHVLYEHGELTGAVNRVVEDINHRFALDVLARDFRSGVLSVSARNLRKDRKHPSDVLDRIDLAAVTDRLRHKLEILNARERKITLTEEHCSEIKEYLDLLDLTFDFDVVSLPNLSRKETKTVISQPGLRYSQTDAIISSLLEDDEFSDLSLAERNYVLSRIESEVLGRLMQDLVLLETKMAYPRKKIFKLQFAIGEFDMVAFDPKTASCEIYEIKHSSRRSPEQYRHLADAEKCERTEFRYGTITGKYVIYRGETHHDADSDIRYLNVEEYLKGLRGTASKSR